MVGEVPVPGLGALEIVAEDPGEAAGVFFDDSFAEFFVFAGDVKFVLVIERRV